MFTCDSCRRTTQPGEKMVKIPIETRKVSYPARYAFRGKEFKDDGDLAVLAGALSKRDMEYALEEVECIDSGGVGHETVREICVCESCAEQH